MIVPEADPSFVRMTKGEFLQKRKTPTISEEFFLFPSYYLCLCGSTELIRRDRREEVLDFALLGSCKLLIVFFEGDETCIEEGTFAMGEDHTSDLLILHIVLHELSDEFFAHFYIIRRTKKRREGI